MSYQEERRRRNCDAARKSRQERAELESELISTVAIMQRRYVGVARVLWAYGDGWCGRVPVRHN